MTIDEKRAQMRGGVGANAPVESPRYGSPPSAHGVSRGEAHDPLTDREAIGKEAQPSNGSAIGKEATESPPAHPFHEPADLYGTPAPARELQRERSIHRLAAYLYMTGLSQKAIAERLGIAAGTISNWVRQSWFQNFVKMEMAVSGRDSLQDVIKGAAADSVFTLIELRDDDGTPASVRMGCCKEILDRAYGKAPQTVHNVSYAGDLNDVERIDGELRSLMADKALMQATQAGMS